MTYFQQMIEAVGNLDFAGDPVDEFVHGSFVLLAAALARLPEDRREVFLARLDRHLREAITKFERTESPTIRWLQ
jgi:hypothetical protein